MSGLKKADEMFSSSRRWRGVFFVTILLRTWFSISPSYIHPDEHFQGPEALADTIFGWATKKSWEFTSEHPARSFVSIGALYGIPMSFAEAVFGDGEGAVKPMTLYYILRTSFAVGTWVLSDMAIDRLSTSKQDRIQSMVFVATSYVTWTFQSHTLSNSVETVLLLWCLVIMQEFRLARSNLLARHFDTGLLGVLVVFGVFNRITFPAFLVLPSLTLFQHFKESPMTIFTFVGSAALMSALAIYIDTWCYGRSGGAGDHYGYVIAPLNNILYNLDSANLSEHGLHSRMNHLLVNLPQLIGPGLIALFSTRYIRSLPLQAAISGLCILSLIPHQEPRFLAPIVPLLCCSFDLRRFSKRMLSLFFAAWVVFNIALGVLMGSLHQGGVVPAQGYIGQNLSKGAGTVLWWKTYSPPIWLLGKPIESVNVLDPLVEAGLTDEQRYEPIFSYLGSKNYSQADTLTVVDLMGCREDWLKEIMDTVSKTSAASESLRRAFLVAPSAAFQANPDLRKLETVQGSGKKRSNSAGLSRYRLTKVWSTRMHLSMESLDFGDLKTLAPGLAIWEIQSL